MAFNSSNCQAGSDYFIQKDKNSLDCFKGSWGNSKHASNRRQEKHDGRSKLEHLDSSNLARERGETNGKSLNGYQISGHCRLDENEIRLTREIRKKEILLNDKLLKAAERLKDVQLRTAYEGRVKSKEQRKTGKADHRLHSIEKRSWESARDGAIGGRRHKGHEGFINQVEGKYGIERQENHVKETNGLKEKIREGQPSRERNMQRTTNGTVGQEWDYGEEMAKHTRGRAGTEKDKKREERVMEGNEVKSLNQKDWHKKKEIVQRINGEKRRGKETKLKRDTDIDDEDQQRDLMDKFASSLYIKRKPVSKHDKTNILLEDHLAAQERVHQYNNRAAEVMPLKVLAEAGPGANSGKRLQQVQFSTESSPDTDVHLLPCKVCNRRFKEDRLKKHISICQKKQETRCQVFDSSKYRAKGTCLEEFLKTNGRSKSPEPKKSNWRQTHEALICNLRQARGPASGGFQPSADLNSYYVTCPHCSRRFAPGPAENHIPKCQYIKSRPPPPRQRH